MLFCESFIVWLINVVQILEVVWIQGVFVISFFVHPHNSNPRPASAAALLRQQLAATSAAGAFDVDSNGSDATAE